MRHFLLLPLLACLLAWLFPTLAMSQAPQTQPQTSPAANASSQPFTIDANDSLEYQQQQKMYVAKGRAKVTRNNASITADTLTAYERDKVGTAKPANKDNSGALGGGGSEIWKVEAEGNVVIDNGDAARSTKAYGDHAIYDIDSQHAILTGRNLHMDSDDAQASERVTARDSFDYYSDRREAIANGNAKAVQTPKPGATNQAMRTINADTLHVFFKDADAPATKPATSKNDSTGSLTADRIEAHGHVHVTTVTAPMADQAAPQTSVATGDAATFNNGAQTALLTGNVKLARGPNQLEGDRAEIDLNSNTSRLLAAPVAANDKTGGAKGRVHGLLIPGSNMGSTGVVTGGTTGSAPAKSSQPSQPTPAAAKQVP